MIHCPEYTSNSTIELAPGRLVSSPLVSNSRASRCRCGVGKSHASTPCGLPAGRPNVQIQNERSLAAIQIVSHHFMIYRKQVKKEILFAFLPSAVFPMLSVSLGLLSTGAGIAMITGAFITTLTSVHAVVRSEKG